MRIVAIVSLAASAVLGLGALFVAKAVLPKGGGAKAQVVAESGRPMVVAKLDIKYGQKLEADQLSVIRIPAQAIPAGAFTTVAQVLAQDSGGPPVALTPIAAREPVLPAKLSGPGARPSVAAEITEGMRAYTIKVTDVSGVGGHALPGDRVDVVMMRDLTPDGPQRKFVATVVLQNVRVLGIDLNADLSSNKPATPSTATLEVAVADVRKLTVAAGLGTLSMALRRTGQADIVTAGVTDADLLGPPTRTPRSRPARNVQPGAARPSTILIEVAGSGRSAGRKSPVAGAGAAAAAIGRPATPAPVTGA